MQPYYFSTADTELFAVYHPPRGAKLRSTAMLLCYPLGHEYLNAHRAYRQMAVQLSAAGFPVLRFDFFGCGDSGGGSEKATLNHWLRNVAQAASELKAKSSATRLCFIGVRLGAALAMMAAAKAGSIDTLVLWDPVIQGRDYNEELKVFHERVLDGAEALSRSVVRPAAYDGFSLFGFGPHLRGELEVLNLLAVQQKFAQRALLIESAESPGDASLYSHLRQCVPAVERRHMPVSEAWRRDYDSLLLPGQIVPAMVRWISEVSA